MSELVKVRQSIIKLAQTNIKLQSQLQKTVKLLESVAEQQAMPDDSWKTELKRILEE